MTAPAQQLASLTAPEAVAIDTSAKPGDPAKPSAPAGKPAKPVSFTTPIRKCPGCGGRHIAVEFFPLLHVKTGGPTHAGFCPVKRTRVMFTPERGKSRQAGKK